MLVTVLNLRRRLITLFILLKCKMTPKSVSPMLSLTLQLLLLHELKLRPKRTLAETQTNEASYKNNKSEIHIGLFNHFY